MIAFDLDDTALDEEKQLRDEVAGALAEAARRGCVVLPATGRMLTGVPKQVLAIPGIRYAITSNGAHVYDLAENRPIYSDCFTRQEALDILQTAMQDEGYISVFIGGRSYTPSQNANFLRGSVSPAVLDYLNTSRIHVADPVALVQEAPDDVEKFTINYASEAAREAARTRLAARGGLTISSSIGLNLELNTPTANKGAALLWLAERLGIARHQVMAVGDSDNDIQMLQAAGHGVAMGNAASRVRRAANAVAPHVQDSGLAAVVRGLWENA